MDTARRIARRIVAETALELPAGTNRLPDNDQWTNRFEVRSESSNRVYTIAQNKNRGHWGCSCPAWRTRRKCKHLRSLGLPELEQPHQVTIASRILAKMVCPGCGTQEVVQDGAERRCQYCGYWDSTTDMSADPAILDDAQPTVIPDDGFADGGEPYTAEEMATMDNGVVTLERCQGCGQETEHADDGTISRCVKCGEEMPSPD